MTKLTWTVRRALRAAPCSTRRLALQAKVPHSTLNAILNDDPAKHRGCTPAVARSVMRGLRAWALRCQRAADAIDHSLPKGA